MLSRNFKPLPWYGYFIPCEVARTLNSLYSVPSYVITFQASYPGDVSWDHALSSSHFMVLQWALSRGTVALDGEGMFIYTVLLLFSYVHSTYTGA